MAEKTQSKDFLNGSSVVLQWTVPEWILIFRYYFRKSFKITALFLFFGVLFLLVWFLREHLNQIVVLAGVVVTSFLLFLLFSYIIAILVIFLLSFLSGKEDEVYLTDKGIWTVASLGAFILFLRLLEKRSGISGIANAMKGNSIPCFIGWQGISVIDVHDKSRMFYINELRGGDSSVKIFIATDEVFEQALELIKNNAKQAIIKHHLH